MKHNDPHLLLGVFAINVLKVNLNYMTFLLRDRSYKHNKEFANLKSPFKFSQPVKWSQKKCALYLRI